MAEGKRLIGIISHVTELKQEIEEKLIVSRNEEGSFVRREWGNKKLKKIYPETVSAAVMQSDICITAAYFEKPA